MSGNGGVMFTSVVSEQCLRRPTRAESEDYCRESCLEMATSDSQSRFPIPMSDFFSSTSKFAPLATKQSGVPHLSQDLFQIPPWESNMGQIPKSTSGFEWRGGRGKMIDGSEVRHCVFKPFPRQFSLPFMWCIAPIYHGESLRVILRSSVLCIESCYES